MSAVQHAPAELASIGDDGAFNTRLSSSLKEIWIDRDLSWLDFNNRVLEEALDNRNPLLERVKFLAIVSSNTDEFFMKRISVLRDSEQPDGEALLRQLRKKIIRAVNHQARCWNDELLPALKENSILLRHWEELAPSQQWHASEFFDSQVSPALTPLIMNIGENFPFVSNLSVSLVFPVLDPAKQEPLYARVKVPTTLRQWLSIPAAEGGTEPATHVRLHEIIQANLWKLYPGMTIGTAALVRITRDAEVESEDSNGETTMASVRRQIKQRRFEPVVRLEFTAGVDAGIRKLLLEHFELSAEDVYEAPDGLDCSTLFEVAGVNAPSLKDAPWTPVTPPSLVQNPNLIAAIQAGDFLVHHPYESFDASVEQFVEQAAYDPNVIAIKMTVYRVGDDTPFARALIKAAEAGKQVACVIELKARFDEERNLHWAAELVKAGAHVSFGLRGLKIHGKTALVVRKESDGKLRSYVHIGTGNYHARTARLYSDAGLFTCDEGISRDAVALFHHLTGHSQAPTFEKLLVAPGCMRPRFLELIDREIQHQRAGRPARIVAKMNQLEDPEMIEALCKASAEGIPVDLIIRGFCCLRPGVAGHTENIRVRSIIGRFLEHSRIYYFANGEREPVDGEFYIGSADWMYRNLSKRIEVVTPVTSSEPKRRLWEILELGLNDRRQSWRLGSDGHYHRVKASGENDHGSGEGDIGVHRRLMELAIRAS
jgi:polyphosphate kinase